MKRILFAVSFSLLIFSSCKTGDNEKSLPDTEQTVLSFQNPVVPGDFADPSVIRVGKDYYATATSAEWAPVYPIMHSTNLKDWKIIGHVFPDKIPDWTVANFWAPEIRYENGKFYIYYTARKKGGPLCTAVASATNPAGPYTDHGPLVCQELGSIDGFAIRDKKDDLYLIWKEDGNSKGQPTPLWGQQMTEERDSLIGEKFELFRNEPGTWEGGLVEGEFLLKRGDYFYAFYSGDKCCGKKCTYGIGVARAKALRGPWEKYENNPLIKQNDDWKCAGHGSMVTDEEGNDYFMYHAYSVDGNVYTGRQGLLDKITWNEDGWPQFAESAPSRQVNTDQKIDVGKLTITDGFQEKELALSWQWPLHNKPAYTIKNGILHIKASPEKIGNILAQKTLSTNYTAQISVDLNSLSSNTRAGLTAIGDRNRGVGIAVKDKKIVLFSSKVKETTIIEKVDLPEADIIHFKLEAQNGDQLRFAWSINGENWNVLNNDEPVNSSFLPPWDRAVRVGFTVKGPENGSAGFLSFIMKPANDEINL